MPMCSSRATIRRGRSRSSAEARAVPPGCAKLSHVDFDEALAKLGFAPSQQRAFGVAGATRYEARPNSFMTYTVDALDDGTAIFSWEFALGDYLADRGLQMGSDEALNQFVFPRQDLRGAQSGAWLVGAIEQTEAMLSMIRLDRPE